jgi:hypothetical protein
VANVAIIQVIPPRAAKKAIPAKIGTVARASGERKVGNAIP